MAGGVQVCVLTIGSVKVTFVPRRAWCRAGLLRDVFIDHEVVLTVSFPAARTGLMQLSRAGWFSDASETAYSDGLSWLIRVGPFGDVPGASKLVRVLLLDLVEHGDSAMMPLRWEATGVMGRMFPVLDANLTLTRETDDTTRLTLNGVYRPPLAGVGAGLDRALLHRAASATVRSLVRSIAVTLCSLEAAAGVHHDAQGLATPCVATEPGPSSA